MGKLRESQNLTIMPLGVGGAFSKNFFHNNYVFDFGWPSNKKLLIDAGTTLRYSLTERGYKADDITDIFITHMHSDHFGGLEELIQRCYYRFENGVHKPHKPTLWVAAKMYPQLMETLSAGLMTNTGTQFHHYFDKINVITVGQIVEIAPGYEFYIMETTDLHIKDMMSFAFKLTRKMDKMNIIFTSDIGQIEFSGIVSHHVDDTTKIIFQDCQFYLPEDSVHAGFEQILNYYPKDLHKKIYLMHYGDDVWDHEEKVDTVGINFVRQGIPIVIE